MEPSQAEANRVVAKLKGEVKKYTIEVFMKSGRVYEYQSDSSPVINIYSSTGDRMLMDGNNYCPIAPMSEIDIVLTQENPK